MLSGNDKYTILDRPTKKFAVVVVKDELKKTVKLRTGFGLIGVGLHDANLYYIDILFNSIGLPLYSLFVNRFRIHFIPAVAFDQGLQLIGQFIMFHLKNVKSWMGVIGGVQTEVYKIE